MVIPKTFGIPYESSINKKPVLCGWCPECRYVYDPYPGPGTSCDGEHEWRNSKTGNERKLLKRLMWKCEPDEFGGYCELYFLSYKELIEHEHSYFV